MIFLGNELFFLTRNLLGGQQENLGIGYRFSAKPGGYLQDKIDTMKFLRNRFHIQVPRQTYYQLMQM